LDDLTLAERLAVIDPADYASLEDLRQALIGVVEQRLDEPEYLPWAKRDDPFVFIRSQMVVFDTDMAVEHPRDMADALVRFSPGSIFYHAIDARQRREDGLDDFRAWVDEFGPPFRPLREALDAIDPYFLTLGDLRNRLIEEFARHGGEVGRGPEAPSSLRNPEPPWKITPAARARERWPSFSSWRAPCGARRWYTSTPPGKGAAWRRFSTRWCR